MKNKPIILTAVLLCIAIAVNSKIIESENIRTVEFLSSFAIGILTGVLLTQIFRLLLKKQ